MNEIMSAGSLSESGVLITDELYQRPCRPINLETEVQILRALGQQLTRPLQVILKYLVSAAVDLCQASSAGVSLIETLPSGEEVFRWVALVGVYEPYEGGSTDREHSPCGVCLSRGCPQLYHHPERYFPSLQQADPPIVEGLVMPLLLEGQALGTIWIASHNEQRQFDGEDVRIMTSLADFTAAALQSSRLRQAAQEAQQAELLLLEQKRLLELTASGHSLDECLSSLCASISRLNRSVRACILLPNVQRSAFKSFITPDFEPSFKEGLKDAPINELAIGTCGTAVYCGQPVTCPDIANDQRWSQEWRNLCIAHGILGCHSAPVLGVDGLPLGSLMLCFESARMPTDWEYQLAEFGTHIASIAIERDRSHQALRKSEELKQRILESSNDCIKVLTLDGQLLFMNTGGTNLFEVDDPASLLNAQWPSFWRGKDQENAMAAIAAAKTGDVGRFQGYCPTAKGTPKWWDVIVTPIRDVSGQIAQLLSISRDITEVKRIEAEREQLLTREQTAREQAESVNRIKDEFLAVLSHELRSPLNPILGWTSLLRNGSLDVSKTTYALETIERNVKLQVQLIEDLLDISRILRGKLSLNVMPVDLNVVIKAALETVRLAAEAKSLQIQTILSPTIVTINADAGRLQQVVWNLLSNAVKFTPNGGQITVELTIAENHAQIEVSDTGKGINLDFLPYIFEHFRQEDGATTRKFGGLGLGLAIARQIVELHGGTIAASSLGLGQGATFTVKLPLLKQDYEINNEPIPVSPTSKDLPLLNVRVLVVEDTIDTRELIVFILEQAGAVVTSVPSASAALSVLAQSKVDVLVSDIGMPEMDGYMLMRKIRAMSQYCHLPAVALTAYAGEIDRQHAQLAGFQEHVSKPIVPEMLVQAIVSLITKLNL